MSETVTSIGKNAGVVWRVLDAHGPLAQDSLFEETKLNHAACFSAVGWLARENKISQVDECFTLGETNMVDLIGKDAGKVWKVLHIWGEEDISSISRLARIDEKRAYAAIGWLGREDKIDTINDSEEIPKTIFKLK